jgi:hypothetical protein
MDGSIPHASPGVRRVADVNPCLGGERLPRIVEALWEVDLIDAHLRRARSLTGEVLGDPSVVAPSRRLDFG